MELLSVLLPIFRTQLFPNAQSYLTVKCEYFLSVPWNYTRPTVIFAFGCEIQSGRTSRIIRTKYSKNTKNIAHKSQKLMLQKKNKQIQFDTLYVIVIHLILVILFVYFYIMLLSSTKPKSVCFFFSRFYFSCFFH